MARTYKEFEDARDIRHETLSLMAGLDQSQSEYQPSPGKWSVGEVLDHLVKLDTLIVRELEVTLNQRSRGLPFTYRGLADFDSTIPWLARPILPFFEVPFSVVNTVLPQSLRRAFTGNRKVPLQAPGVIKPRFGRPVATLRSELEATYRIFAEQQSENSEFDLKRVYYYNPITGFNSVAGMYRFVSNHEERHQGQLRDIFANPSFPAPTETARTA